MATIVNTTPTSSGESSGVSFVVGAVLLVLAVVLILLFAAPALRGVRNAAPANTAPSQSNTTNEAPAIQVPDEVNVNLKGAEQPQQ